MSCRRPSCGPAVTTQLAAWQSSWYGWCQHWPFGLELHLLLGMLVSLTGHLASSLADAALLQLNPRCLAAVLPCCLTATERLHQCRLAHSRATPWPWWPA